MAINASSISSIKTTQEYTVCIEIVATPPQVGVVLDTPTDPGKIVGYFNMETGLVELYVANELGSILSRVG